MIYQKIRGHLELLKSINICYDKCSNAARENKEFFSCRMQEDFETMAKQDEYIEEAVNTLFELSADEQKRLEYEAREKAIRDDRARQNWAMKTGLEEGLKQGLALASRIIQLKQSGKILEEISTDCGLSQEQIKGILGE